MSFLEWLTTWREMNISKDERARACRSCEILQRELDRAHAQKERLLNELLYAKQSKPNQILEVAEKEVLPEEMKRVLSPVRNWDATRMKLEADDARRAEAQAKEEAIRKVREIDELARKNAGGTSA